jgi:hypothetical protein
MRIFSDYELYQIPEYNKLGERYLEIFDQYFGRTSFYGPREVSFNVHNLVHITKDVRNFGNVGNYSASRFENYLQQFHSIKRVRSNPLLHFPSVFLPVGLN